MGYADSLRFPAEPPPAYQNAERSEFLMPLFRSNVTLSSPQMGGEGINSWHVDVTGITPDVQSNLQEAADVLQTFYTAIRDYIANGATMRHDGDWTRVEAGEDGFEVTDPWVVGSGAPTGVAPPELAVVAGWGTASRRKSGYGRTFLGPLSSGALQGDGTPADALVTGIRAAQDALIASSDSANGWAFVVYSRKNAEGLDFASRTVHDRFAVLRSRRP